MSFGTLQLAHDLLLLLLTLTGMAFLVALAWWIPVCVAWHASVQGSVLAAHLHICLHWVPEVSWGVSWQGGTPGLPAWHTGRLAAGGLRDIWPVVHEVRRALHRLGRRAVLDDANIDVILGAGNAAATGLAAGAMLAALGGLEAYIRNTIRVPPERPGQPRLGISVRPVWGTAMFSARSSGILLAPLGHIIVAGWQVSRALRESGNQSQSQKAGGTGAETGVR